MRETYLYHGHSIALNLTGMNCARIGWTYFIDEQYCVQGTMDSMPIEAVRVNALELAHRSIDVLDSITSKNGDSKSSPADDSFAISGMMVRGSPIATPYRVKRSP